MAEPAAKAQPQVPRAPTLLETLWWAQLWLKRPRKLTSKRYCNVYSSVPFPLLFGHAWLSGLAFCYLVSMLVFAAFFKFHSICICSSFPGKVWAF